MKDLQKDSKITLPLVQISKPADLLRASSISQVLKTYEVKNVLMEIRLYVEKCANALNIKMNDGQVSTLCEDLMETYKHDSLEDLRECLKAGRRGEYGFGHEQRNSLNMLIVRQWMGKHLEKKSLARENVQEDKNREYKRQDESSMVGLYKDSAKFFKPPQKKKSDKIVKSKETKELIEQMMKDQKITPNYRSEFYQNAQKMFKDLQDKLNQEIELNEDDEAFMKYHKMFIIDKKLYTNV